jgi:hypothetical protein
MLKNASAGKPSGLALLDAVQLARAGDVTSYISVMPSHFLVTFLHSLNSELKAF